MRLIITRHGETVENANNIAQGQTGGTLSGKGKEQARKLAERLKGEKIDAIYSSDLARAADTAKEIAKFHPRIKAEFTKELRERDIKDFEGKRHDEVEWYDSTGKVETDEMMRERAKGFIDRLCEKHCDGTVLAVAHGGINGAMMSVIMGKSFSEVFDMAEWENTNVTIFEIGEGGYSIECLNCAKHLKQKS